VEFDWKFLEEANNKQRVLLKLSFKQPDLVSVFKELDQVQVLVHNWFELQSEEGLPIQGDSAFTSTTTVARQFQSD